MKHLTKVIYILVFFFSSNAFAQSCDLKDIYDVEKQRVLFNDMVSKAAYVGVVRILEASPINKSTYELKLQPVYPYTINTNQDIYVRHHFSNLQKSPYTDIGSFHEVIILKHEKFRGLQMAPVCAYINKDSFFKELRDSRQKDLRKRVFIQAKTSCYNKGGRWTLENNRYFCKYKASQ